MTAIPVSGARLLDRTEALARYSEQADGLTRVFLSPELRSASDLVLGWMREAGMAVFGWLMATLMVVSPALTLFVFRRNKN